MAKTPKKSASTPGLPPHEIVATSVAKKALKVKELDLINRKIGEIAEVLWRYEDMPEDERNVRIHRAIELFNSLEPEDGAESMLATQMVATHFAAMECLRRVALPGQTFEGRDVNLKHAQKLMALYTKQLETLNKSRGKGQQKVTVEHVNVAPGGQAIVGHVETRQRGDDDEPPRLVHDPLEPLPAIEEPEKEKAKAPRKGGKQ